MSVRLPPGVRLEGVDGDLIATSSWPVDDEEPEFETVSDQLEGGDQDDEDS